MRQLSELDDHTEQYLSDPDNDLRVCAALAPGLAGNATATNIIIDALARGADHGIANPDLYTLGELIDAAIARIDDFELIAAPAQTIIRHEDWTGFDATWGPLLLAAFSTAYNDKTKLSAAQRDILAAMVANPGCGTTRTVACRWYSTEPGFRSTEKPAPGSPNSPGKTPEQFGLDRGEERLRDYLAVCVPGRGQMSSQDRSVT